MSKPVFTEEQEARIEELVRQCIAKVIHHFISSKFSMNASNFTPGQIEEMRQIIREEIAAYHATSVEEFLAAARRGIMRAMATQGGQAVQPNDDCSPEQS